MFALVLLIFLTCIYINIPVSINNICTIAVIYLRAIVIEHIKIKLFLYPFMLGMGNFIYVSIYIQVSDTPAQT